MIIFNIIDLCPENNEVMTIQVFETGASLGTSQGRRRSLFIAMSRKTTFSALRLLAMLKHDLFKFLSPFKVLA